MTRALTCSLLLAGILPAAQAPPRFLLPDVAQPRRYAIDLAVLPESATFRGTARIDLELNQSVSSLWLNGKDLAVDSATLSGMPARVTAAGGEFLNFAPAKPVGPGPARLEIRYRGKIDSKTATGVFRKRSAGDWYVFTTFTAIEARRAFPCFDEPRFKTPWNLTLHVPRAQTALANTHALREAGEPGGMKRVEFAPTEPLPSSLVAFAVGPFEIVDAGRAGKNAVPVRIITPRGRAAEASAARDATPQLLAQLEEYTAIPYPFDKLDHVALIEGAFGAIENPGLITYQQRILLARPEQDSPERRRHMRSTMAHELAHQWFGNLVTMSAWEDVWLSEGFATWMAAKIMDREQPAGRSGVLAVAARGQAMAVDTRPIRMPMRSRQEMRSVYATVVYEKGAAALRMIERWLGEDTFRAGVRRYLAAHRYGTAATIDLARELESSGPVLSALLDQSGVPLIRVETRCDSTKFRIVLHQDRGQPLPVCVKADGLSARCVTMEAPEAEVPLPACPAWVFADAGASGYYRTLLSPELAASLANHGDQLTAAERLSFAEDVSALVRSARMPAAEALGLLPSMAQDSEPMVVMAAANLAGALAAIVPPALKPKYDRYLQSVPPAPSRFKPRELELFRAAQQKSLVEFLTLGKF